MILNEDFHLAVYWKNNSINLNSYLDMAYNYIVYLSEIYDEFEFPDYVERLAIWKNALFFPFHLEAGLSDRLAKNYQLSGGSIYNVVSDAVVECVDADITSISFELMESALKNEFKKTGRKYEVCPDEMVSVNPVRRYGPGYEKRLNF